MTYFRWRVCFEEPTVGASDVQPTSCSDPHTNIPVFKEYIEYFYAKHLETCIKLKLCFVETKWRPFLGCQWFGWNWRKRDSLSLAPLLDRWDSLIQPVAQQTPPEFCSVKQYIFYYSKLLWTIVSCSLSVLTAYFGSLKNLFEKQITSFVPQFICIGLCVVRMGVNVIKVFRQ